MMVGELPSYNTWARCPWRSSFCTKSNSGCDLCPPCPDRFFSVEGATGTTGKLPPSLFAVWSTGVRSFPLGAWVLGEERCCGKGIVVCSCRASPLLLRPEGELDPHQETSPWPAATTVAHHSPREAVELCRQNEPMAWTRICIRGPR